ncbi:hypothetical protein [Haliangium sp.]|uniref:hypothetical protein n=1 Tax=Haliangium sp. TaxID=2663208 RepID=UPI003D0D7FAE
METHLQEESAVLSWRLEEQAAGIMVEFFGEIDENVDFSALRRQLEGSVTFHLGAIRRINSCGVREWVNFVRDLPRVTSLTFTHCSPAIVTQLNMIYNFRGNADIESFYAPYVCDNCNAEVDKLLEVEAQFPRNGQGRAVHEMPSFTCQRCQQPMEFDDLPERYLSFLMEL